MRLGGALLFLAIVVAVQSCKKETQNSSAAVSKTAASSVQQKTANYFASYSKNLAVNSKTSIQSVSALNDAADNYAKIYISDSIGAEYISSVYEPTKAKFKNLTFGSDALAIQSSGAKLKIQQLAPDPDNPNPDDLPEIGQSVIDPIAQIGALSTTVTNSISSLNDDLSTLAVNYATQRYLADSTNAELGDPTDFINQASAVVTQHTNYAYTYAMTNNEYTAYSIALFTVNQDLSNRTYIGLPQAVAALKRVQTQALKVNGLFSWVSNILKPIATFIVQVVAAVVVVAAAVALGAVIAGTAGFVVGFAAGLFIYDTIVKERVYKKLQDWGWYDPTVVEVTTTPQPLFIE